MSYKRSRVFAIVWVRCYFMLRRVVTQGYIYIYIAMPKKLFYRLHQAWVGVCMRATKCAAGTKEADLQVGNNRAGTVGAKEADLQMGNNRAGTVGAKEADLQGANNRAGNRKDSSQRECEALLRIEHRMSVRRLKFHVKEEAVLVSSFLRTFLDDLRAEKASAKGLYRLFFVQLSELRVYMRKAREYRGVGLVYEDLHGALGPRIFRLLRILAQEKHLLETPGEREQARLKLEWQMSWNTLVYQ